jgi:hypothetical protein
MFARRWVLSACAVALAAAAASGRAAAETPVVPSLTPAATQAEWQQLVDRPQLRANALAAADCTPLRVVFYAPTDWLRLATDLAANPNQCADYFVSVPPLTADKTQARTDQAWRIRALGPGFHALDEVNVTGWTSWVAANGGDWYAAGVEARRRMLAAGFDVTAGDTWAVNELSSAVRQGTGAARANMRAFVHGLYDGDGGPPTKGVVFVNGIGQSTADLSTYQARLEDWYLDSGFWSDMSAYVSDWAQEVYGDIRDYAVAGASPDARRAALDQYLQHETALAAVAPPDGSAAAAFLAGAYTPLGNAAWQYDSAFGWTHVPIDLMEDFVTAQVDAAAAAGDTDVGFAWSPKNLDGLSTSDFASQTDALLARLAAAIADPVNACGTDWCNSALDGAALVGTWTSLATWQPPQLAFTSAPQTLAPGSASAPITVSLETATGVPYSAGLPVTVELSSSSATGGLATSPDGPWSPTLELQIPSGASSASFYFSDPTAGTPTIAAAATDRTGGTEAVSVVAPPVVPPPPPDTTPPPSDTTPPPSNTTPPPSDTTPPPSNTTPPPSDTTPPSSPPASTSPPGPAPTTTPEPAPVAFTPPPPVPTRSVEAAAVPLALAVVRPMAVVLTKRPVLRVTVRLSRAATLKLVLLGPKGATLASWTKRGAAGADRLALVLPPRAKRAGADRLRVSVAGLVRTVPVALRAQQRK